MKNLANLAVCSLLSLQILSAAPQTIEPYGLIKTGGKYELNIPDPTRFVIELSLEHESLEVGVYARYAQKFLGVRAPLVAKNETRIVDARIFAADDARAANEANEIEESWVNPLPINVLSHKVQPQEDAAEDAARELLRIRDHRRDFMLGNGINSSDSEQTILLSDHKASIEELNRQEQLYVELFMGRSSKSRSIARFEVMLDGKQERYLIGRFSESKGVVDASDISGEPLMLQLKLLKQRDVRIPTIDTKIPKMTFIVANPVECQLLLGTRQLSSTTLPLFEFGTLLEYPVITK